jgi:hypothetical protein
MKLKCVRSCAKGFTEGKEYEVIGVKQIYDELIFEVISKETSRQIVPVPLKGVYWDFEIADEINNLENGKERENMGCVSGLEAIDLMKANGIIMQSANEDSFYLYKVENGKVLWTTIYDTNNWKEDTRFDFTDTYIPYTPKKLSGWHNLGEGDFYTIYSGGVVELEDGCLEDDYADEDRFSTAEKAEEIEFQQRLFRKLQRFSDENGGNEIDWNNNKKKCYIYFDYRIDTLKVGTVTKLPDFGQVYFNSYELAHKAIELFHDDLIKYFTM